MKNAYKTQQVEKYIKSLPLKEQAIINAQITQLEQSEFAYPHIKKLTKMDKAWEITYHQFRVIFTVTQQGFILLYGYNKQSMPMPKHQKNNIIKMLKEYGD